MSKLIDKIIEWFVISNRYKHLIGGAIWGLCFYIIAVVLTSQLWQSFWLAQISTIGIASALEFKDYQHGGEFDESDILSTLIGSIVVCLLAVIATFIFL